MSGNRNRRIRSLVLVAVIAIATLSAAITAPMIIRAQATGRALDSIDAAVGAGLIDRQVVTDLRDTGDARAIVRLDVDGTLKEIEKQLGKATTAQLLDVMRGTFSGQKKEIMKVLGKDAELVRDFEYLASAVVVFHSEDALLAAARTRLVAKVAANEEFEATLEDSLRIINQPPVLAAGNRGDGIYAGVIDSGVDAERYTDFFPAGSIAGTREFAPEDNAADNLGHGTHVSSTVLAVAPGAKLFVGDVFRVTGYDQRGNPIQRAYGEDIESAVAWLVGLKAQGYDIRAMNLSLGGRHFSQLCDDGYGFREAYLAGIIPVVSSGNSAYEDDEGNATTDFQVGIASPACSEYALSVGATTDGFHLGSNMCDPSIGSDDIATFSQAVAVNGFSEPDMLAPGTCIVAAGGEMQGTSMASPHVTGAAAVLAAAKPSATAADVWNALVKNGPEITDRRSGRTAHRLDLQAALTALTGGTVGDPNPDPDPGTPTDPITPIGTDTTAPAVTAPRISFDNGSQLDASDRVHVTVSWSATDPSGIAQHAAMFSVDGGEWANVTIDSLSPTTAAFWLPTGHKVQFIAAAKDGAGNWSEWAMGTPMTVERYAENHDAMSFSGTWNTISWDQALDGSTAASDQTGDYGCFRFNASSIAWLATRASNRGAATVWLDGSVFGTVDLGSDTLQAKSVVYTADVTPGVDHTLCVQVAGTAGRPDVDIDGFALLY